VNLRSDKDESGMGSCLMAVFGIRAIEPLDSATCVLVMTEITDKKIHFLF
jgi:hypothetical protein